MSNSSVKVGYTADFTYVRREALEYVGIRLYVQSYSRFTIWYKNKQYNINLKRDLGH